MLGSIHLVAALLYLDSRDYKRADVEIVRAMKVWPNNPVSVFLTGERLAADGSVLLPLDTAALAGPAHALLDRGVRVAAVALMHAYRDPRHEQELKRRLLGWGFEHVSCSAEIAPRIKLLPRAQTAVVDAYLAPVVRTYLDRVGEALRSRRLLVMTSRPHGRSR